ncbi:MAG: type II toxin-antitoxin system HicA family toxin [Xanthobacteraceae bacterium]
MKVRDVIRLIERDGWFPVATRGSHRQYKHPTKPGRLQLPESRPTTWRRVRLTACSSRPD